MNRPSHSHAWSFAERWLLGCLALLCAIAVLGPNPGAMLSLHAQGHAHMYPHGHPFIDARALRGIPNALDVLSNLPFLLGGVAGLWMLSRWEAHGLQVATLRAARVFFVGLILTFAGSSYYHWAPDAWGLMWDRAGMAVVFAGALGLAVCERASLRIGAWLPAAVCVAGGVSAWVCYHSGNVLPWAVVQFGGAALLMGLAVCKPLQRAGSLPRAPQISWGLLIALYAMAKLLEAGDAWVFHATHEVVSGHTLKHLFASCAAWPVGVALWRAMRRTA